MSSFIVNDKTINRLLTFIDKWNFNEDKETKEAFFNLTAKPYREEDIDAPEKVLSRVGTKLLSLNAEAVSQRYSEEQQEIVYLYQYKPCKLPQAYNHLRCLTYQMAEGDIVKKKLYRILQKMETLMAVEIADGTEEVKKAEWEAK